MADRDSSNRSLKRGPSVSVSVSSSSEASRGSSSIRTRFVFEVKSPLDSLSFL